MPTRIKVSAVIPGPRMSDVTVEQLAEFKAWSEEVAERVRKDELPLLEGVALESGLLDGESVAVAAYDLGYALRPVFVLAADGERQHVTDLDELLESGRLVQDDN